MSGHTQGEWVVLPEEVDRPYMRIRGTCLGGRYKIANVPTPLYDGVNEREAKETRANARLIAAAPDLLASLIEMRELFDLMCGLGFAPIAGHDGSRKANADAAIAKATQVQS